MFTARSNVGIWALGASAAMIMPASTTTVIISSAMG
jgi:hypothetical protein